MKKLFLLLGVALLATTPMSAQEQPSQKDINKEAKAMLKMSNQQLNEKASKAAKKEAVKAATKETVVKNAHVACREDRAAVKASASKKELKRVKKAAKKAAKNNK